MGAHSGGWIQLTYDLSRLNPLDPNFDPAADLEASGQIISAAASIDVTPTADFDGRTGTVVPHIVSHRPGVDGVPAPRQTAYFVTVAGAPQKTPLLRLLHPRWNGCVGSVGSRDRKPGRGNPIPQRPSNAVRRNTQLAAESPGIGIFEYPAFAVQPFAMCRTSILLITQQITSKNLTSPGTSFMFHYALRGCIRNGSGIHWNRLEHLRRIKNR